MSPGAKRFPARVNVGNALDPVIDESNARGGEAMPGVSVCGN